MDTNIIKVIRSIFSHKRVQWEPIPGILVYIPTTPDMPPQPPQPQTTHVIVENETYWSAFVMDLVLLGYDVNRPHRNLAVTQEPTGVISEYVYVPLNELDRLRGKTLTRVILYNVAITPEQHYRLKAEFRDNPLNIFTIIN